MLKRGELAKGRFKLRYRIYGDAPRTIVCVNGAQQTIGAWRTFVSHFRGRYRVVVYDPPGQGISRILSGPEAVSLDEQVEVLDWIVAETAADRATIDLCAASWGAVVAAVYAERHPDTADRIILGGFGLTPTPMMSDLIGQGVHLFFENRPDAIGRLIVDNFGQNISDLYKRQIVEQFQAMQLDRWITLFAQCWFIENAGHFSRYADLTRIRARTLIINGAEDTLIDPGDAIQASRLIPDCELKFVPNVGHFLHFERPEVLEVYDSFLARGDCDRQASLAALA